jgi:hypothetical protein
VTSAEYERLPECRSASSIAWRFNSRKAPKSKFRSTSENGLDLDISPSPFGVRTARSHEKKPSPDHGAIDEVLDLLTVVLAQFAGRRGSYDHDKTFLRVAEELRAECAIPGELARVAGNR